MNILATLGWKTGITGTMFAQVQEEQENGKAKIEDGTIHAEALNRTEDNLGEYKAQEQRRAIKELLHQFNSDSEVESSLHEMQGHRTEMRQFADSAIKEMERIEEMKQNLQEAYGIEENELEAEAAQLPEEYQKAMEQYDAMSEVWKTRKEDARQGAIADSKTMIAINIERAKQHGMVDAMKEANKIMETASEEAANQLLADGKDNIDAKMEKEKEEAAKLEKEKKEEEEKLEKAAQQAEPDKTTKQSLQADTEINDIDAMMQELRRYIQTEQVLPEDAIGILIDEQK